MNGLTLQIEYILTGVAILLSLLGLCVAVIMPGLDRWNKRFYLVYFLILLLYAGFGLAEQFAYKRPDMVTALKVYIYVDSLLPSVLLCLMTVYLINCCKENWRQSPLFRTVAILWSVFFIMLNMTPFTTLFYYVCPGNQLCRGPLYPLILALMYVVIIINLVGVIHLKNRLSKRIYYAFLAEMLPLAIVMFIHFFVPVFAFIDIGFAIGALSMFFIMLSDQIEQYLRQQRNIAHQRASIMVLQMRPHFIYNTMMSIYYLCKQNPDLAQQVTLDFTTYLRRNFTALASEESISFSDELEHTRAYLAIEQAQFDDMIIVDWDTPFTCFRLPPLTLQPIVENAVKHGMDPDADHLHIFIRTRDTGAGVEISVEDTGSGFDPTDESRSHTTLENIRQRLEMICGGSMTIKPREDGGTVVTITIPDSTTHPNSGSDALCSRSEDR